MKNLIMIIITAVLYGGALVLSGGMILLLYCLVIGNCDIVENLHITFPFLVKLAIGLCIGWVILAVIPLIVDYIERRNTNPKN
jgi:hypothetical protein